MRTDLLEPLNVQEMTKDDFEDLTNLLDKCNLLFLPSGNVYTDAVFPSVEWLYTFYKRLKGGNWAFVSPKKSQRVVSVRLSVLAPQTASFPIRLQVVPVVTVSTATASMPISVESLIYEDLHGAVLFGNGRHRYQLARFFS